LNFGQWLGLLGLVAGLLVLWSLREVVVLIFAAVVVAMALCTLVGIVRRQLGCSRGLAMALSLLGLLVVAAVAATAIIPPFLAQFHELLLKPACCMASGMGGSTGYARCLRPRKIPAPWPPVSVAVP
jgi:predicted PurR-regulated permease PerM